MHINESLRWTLVEVRITEYLEELDAYRAIIERFDGHRQTLAGLSLGDELVVKQASFFAVWGPGQTQDDAERRRVHQQALSKLLVVATQSREPSLPVIEP